MRRRTTRPHPFGCSALDQAPARAATLLMLQDQAEQGGDFCLPRTGLFPKDRLAFRVRVPSVSPPENDSSELHGIFVEVTICDRKSTKLIDVCVVNVN